MNIAKVGESQPDRDQPKPAPKRRPKPKPAVTKETAADADKPPDDAASARRVDVVA